MGGWAGWLIPIASVLLIGTSATLYLHRVRLPREEAAAGVTALAGMRWRDFIHVVLDALIRRGYERTFEPQSAGEEGDYMLERGGQRFLLSSKHGAAYVLGSTAIAEFANIIRMRGATGGLLVTSGQFAPEARPLARAQRIELLDGPTLWPELRPLLPDDQRSEISAPSQAYTRRLVGYSWAGALAVGMLLFVLLHHQAPPDTATMVAPTGARPAPTSPKPTAQAPVTRQAEDPARDQQRRNEVASAISALPGIDRATWESRSTLLVHLLDDADPMPSICPLLERYDELAATRLQLQPPPGSSKTVRFVQCRVY